MRWQFWQKAGPLELSDQVKQALKSQFTLGDQNMDDWRFLAKKGRFSGRRAEFIRIYDPALMKNGSGPQPAYDDFIEDNANRAALLFEGRIETINDVERVFLTARRDS